MAAKPLYERIVKILPRNKLEEWAQDYCGNDRPWDASRAFLEAQLASKMQKYDDQCRKLKEEIIDWIGTML